MKVFVVWEECYENSTVHNAFSTREKAEKYIKDYCFNSPDRVSFGIKGKEKNDVNFPIFELTIDEPRSVQYEDIN